MNYNCILTPAESPCALVTAQSDIIAYSTFQTSKYQALDKQTQTHTHVRVARALIYPFCVLSSEKTLVIPTDRIQYTFGRPIYTPTHKKACNKVKRRAYQGQTITQLK